METGTIVETEVKLKYVCQVCKTEFLAKGNKKGAKAREVLHCGKTAWFRGVEGK